MADYHTQYKGPEGETTEWDDIHIRLGNMAPKAKPAAAPEYEPDSEPSTINAAKLRDISHVDELDDLEDELEDDPYLEELRCEWWCGVGNWLSARGSRYITYDFPNVA